ncbi:MAG: hypothetical protein H7X88_03050 [Gloeobacteraceae cyanobacterium ES-bin-316]|nr:hypothetical protein [Ferruginibacter sp.]
MKNIFLSLSAILILSFSSQAQKTKKVAAKVNVPENVNASFKGTFATVEKSEWNKTNVGNYVASFTNTDNLSQVAEYNQEGVMVKSKVIYNLEALPENVTSALSKKYADAKVTECVKMQIPGVTPYYKVKLETSTNQKRELFISEEGSVVE